MDKELQKKLITEVMHQDEDLGLYDTEQSVDTTVGKMNWQDTRISRIIELELELTRAVINGHTPSEDDQYKEKREELKRLREEVDPTFKKKVLWTKVQKKKGKQP